VKASERETYCAKPCPHRVFGPCLWLSRRVWLSGKYIASPDRPNGHTCHQACECCRSGVSNVASYALAGHAYRERRSMVC
jgi:hypothetical protein